MVLLGSHHQMVSFRNLQCILRVWLHLSIRFLYITDKNFTLWRNILIEADYHVVFTKKKNIYLHITASSCTIYIQLFTCIFTELSIFIADLSSCIQLLRNRLVKTARECLGKNASLVQVYGKLQEAYQEMQSPLIYQEPSARVGCFHDFVNTSI